MNTRGFSTLELLITFAVMTLTLSAIVIVAFGNQSLAIDTELAQRAIYLTERNLEEAGAAAYGNFDSVEPVITPAAVGEVFDTAIRVSDISECAIRITSESKWNRGLRSLTSSLTSIFVSPQHALALGGNCVTEGPASEWNGPAASLTEDISGQSHATAIAIAKGHVFLTTNPDAATESDLFIYEFDGSALTLREDLNTDSSNQIGLMDIAVASMDDALYAFAASASATAQLRIFDVTDPENPDELFALGLPGVDALGQFPEGWSVYYYDEKVYIGTRRTAGPEFHIFDVSGLPSSAPAHIGSIELNHHVNDIMVRGDYAYIASSDNNRELMVIDISDPAHLDHPDATGFGFNASGADDGTAVYVTGQKVYLGRERNASGTGDDLYILERTKVQNGGSQDDGELGKADIELSNNAYVSSIAVRGDLAFLSLNDSGAGLAIFNISDPENISSVSSHGDHAVGLAMDGHTVYLAGEGGAELEIIHDNN